MGKLAKREKFPTCTGFGLKNRDSDDHSWCRYVCVQATLGYINLYYLLKIHLIHYTTCTQVNESMNIAMGVLESKRETLNTYSFTLLL